MSIKKAIRNVVIGLMCIPALALSLSFIPLSQPVFAEEAATSTLKMSDGASAAKSDEQATSLFGEKGLFKTITNVALFLLGAVSVLMLIYGGIRYTISGGDSGAITAAKNTILYAIVGIVVALLAYAIISFVIGVLAATPVAK